MPPAPLATPALLFFRLIGCNFHLNLMRSKLMLLHGILWGGVGWCLHSWYLPTWSMLRNSWGWGGVGRGRIPDTCAHGARKLVMACGNCWKPSSQLGSEQGIWETGESVSKSCTMWKASCGARNSGVKLWARLGALARKTSWKNRKHCKYSIKQVDLCCPALQILKEDGGFRPEDPICGNSHKWSRRPWKKVRFRRGR